MLLVLIQTGRCSAPPGQPGSMPTRRLAHPVCPDNEICVAPIGICRHSRRSCWSCFTIVEMSCNRDSESIWSSWEKEYPSLTMRACDGLSWDTPAGYNLSKAVPAVIGRREFVNVQL